MELVRCLHCDQRPAEWSTQHHHSDASGASYPICTQCTEMGIGGGVEPLPNNHRLIAEMAVCTQMGDASGDGENREDPTEVARRIVDEYPGGMAAFVRDGAL